MTLTGSTITDSHPHGNLTVTEVIQKSSNVGAVRMAMTFTPREMWELYSAVGFGQKPQLGFPGVVTGRLRPYKSWRPIEQATMSYGYGLSASLFQIAHAYTVFAHDGELIPVTLTRPLGGGPAPLGSGIRVLSPKTAAAVRNMLHLATLPGGTAPKAQVIGYSVGGKSGTAYKQEGASYATKKYRSWFVGMAPIHHPRIIVAVMVDEPSAGKYFGGDVAAPVFSEVVQQTLRMMGVQPDLDVKPQIVSREMPGRRGKLLGGEGEPARRWRGSSRARRRTRGCVLRGARALAADSRRVASGDAFIAWPGHASDGRRFVGAALAAGASACLVEADGVEAFGFDARAARRRAARPEGGGRRHREPLPRHAERKLDVVAVTGTNGKTSTAWWIAQALAAARPALRRRRHARHRRTAARSPARALPPSAAMRSTGLTTPDPVTLQNALHDFVERGFAACAIEASSIGIAEHRLAGTQVEVAVFTNFTQDHLDYHGDMRAYWQAKAQLFAWPGLRAAVVNLDDAQGLELADSLAGAASTAGRLDARRGGAPARRSAAPRPRAASPSTSSRASSASRSRRR